MKASLETKVKSKLAELKAELARFPRNKKGVIKFDAMTTVMHARLSIVEDEVKLLEELLAA
jgi:hypothetical protein